MKKIIPLLLFLIMVVIFPLISAIEINMPSEIPKGETIIASFSGNFIDSITKNNVFFYRGHVKTSFDYDIARIGDIYYIYAETVGKAENNYSINISGVRYYVGSQVSRQPILKNFKIINETADFSVDPGFIIGNQDFSVKVQNLQAGPITININTKTDSGSSNGFFGFLFNNAKVGQSITLLSGQIKYLNIHLEDINETTIRTITLSTENTEYNIPCYIILENGPEVNATIDNNTTIDENNTIIDNETIIEDNITNKSGCSFFQTLFGTCNLTVQNETLENETVPLNNTNMSHVNNKTNSSKDYDLINIGNKTVAIRNGTILNESATSKTCLQIKGKVCASGELCQNSTIYAKDAKCCMSSCVKENGSTNTKLIGWGIVGVIVIVVLRFFFVRLKNMKRKSDPLLNPKK
jgi:hypothetical protein